ncbi:MAG TPA: hypothetical protein VIQ99_06850, partial [Gammaproteobacteria bacterium]
MQQAQAAPFARRCMSIPATTYFVVAEELVARRCLVRRVENGELVSSVARLLGQKALVIRLFTLSTLIFLGALLTTSLARSQEAVPEEPGDEPTEEIVVTGQQSDDARLREYVTNFVMEIGDTTSSWHGYARWRKSICVGVVNAPTTGGAEFIADRVGDIARELGLAPQGQGCTPNIVMIFARDAAAVASRWVDSNPRLFRPFGGEGGTTQGVAALQAFATTDAPVRWWQISMVVDWSGQPAFPTPTQPEFGIKGPLSGQASVAGANSNIVNSVEGELTQAFMIVDTTKLGRVSWEQLADYAAMVALAQIDPDGNAAGYDSILNLFQSPSSVAGLTDWDWSYLRALY